MGEAKAVQKLEAAREAGQLELVEQALGSVYAKIRTLPGQEGFDPAAVGIGSTIYAVKPGDGSAREQAASCQRVLGAWANLAQGYATKRYRSNLINWGMVPFLVEGEPNFSKGDYLFIPGLRQAILSGAASIPAYVIGEQVRPVTLSVGSLTQDEKKILCAGCLINFYRSEQ